MNAHQIQAHEVGPRQVGDAILFPDALAIPGLSFRTFRGAADYAYMADIHGEAMAADRFDRTATADEMALWHRPVVGFDPFTQLLFAEVDGVPVAFASVRHVQEADGCHIFWLQGMVRPAWRRRGLGRTLLRHNEWRARQLAAHIERGELCLVRAMAIRAGTGAVALLERNGYEPVRYFFGMARPTLDDISEAPLPPGLDVRPVRPEHYRTIWEAEQEVFRGAWGFWVGGEEDYQTWLNDPLFDPSLWRVAWDGDQVAGQVRSFISVAENQAHGRRRGYTENISVRQPWRRRGLATALLCRSLHALKAAGMTEAALSVDAANPDRALDLYERCGFHVVQEMTYYEKPVLREFI